MSKLSIVAIVLVILIGGYVYMDRGTSPSNIDAEMQVQKNADTNQMTQSSGTTTAGAVKEFTVQSWMEHKDNKITGAFFSLKEIRVKKGDTVKITITNTAGTHDFVLDEYGIKQETPLNQPVVVQFVADKTGTFEYYCSKYNHRQIGQKGNLIVE